MCNSQNEQIVRDVVAAMVASSQPFTCWDISRESWRRGADEPHRALKGCVHGMFNNGEITGYDRTLINTPSGQAWCYHYAGFDANDYAATINGSVPSSPVAGPAAPDVVDNGSDAADDASDFERKQATDKDGRLPIWSDMLRSLGFTKLGQVVFVCFEKGKFVARSFWDTSMKPSIANYSINKDGRIRIGGKVLKESFRSKSGTFSVKLNMTDRCIEISPI